MKFAAITLLAFVAVATSGPVRVSDNNVGDIVTVLVNANAVLENHIDQNIISVIAALLNQQGIVVGGIGGNDGQVPAQQLPAELNITPEMIERVKGFLTKQ